MLWVLKEPSHWDGSFEHPKHMFQLMDKKYQKLTIFFCHKTFIILTMIVIPFYVRNNSIFVDFIRVLSLATHSPIK